MDSLFNFIKDNYWWLIIVSSVLLEFILLLIFKKPKLVLKNDGYWFKLMSLISQAEKLFGSGRGKDKLYYVVDEFLKSSSQDFSTSELIKQIEFILSLPERKEKK